jgi:uncharacterized protein
MVIDHDRLRAIVHGGALLGAGGGGSIAAGLAAGRDALSLGTPNIVPLHRLPSDATLVTLSAVGTARGTSAGQIEPWHFARALDLFANHFGRRIDGLIASEVGPLAVTYGWRESIATGIPVVDAPCNGRAHPLFVMGSLGLHRAPLVHLPAVAVGGRRNSAESVELSVRANVVTAARIVRGEADRAAISLAVVRNPVPARFARKRAAVGALQHALTIGLAMLDSLGGSFDRHLARIARASAGRMLGKGRISTASLREHKGFTVGTIEIDCPGKSRFSVPVCNEYMLAVQDGQPVAVFPDVIALIDRESGLPLASGEAVTGREVAILTVPQDRLILGAAMRDRTLLRPIERLLDIRFPPVPARPDTRIAA